jgi:hypothetical protein
MTIPAAAIALAASSPEVFCAAEGVVARQSVEVD